VQPLHLRGFGAARPRPDPRFPSVTIDPRRLARRLLYVFRMNLYIDPTYAGFHLDRAIARHGRAARRTRISLAILALLALTLPLLLV
jgi:hypothetical protein